MTIHLHKGDLPDNFKAGKVIAVDTETMGLKNRRDRLCVVQLSTGDGEAHLVQLAKGDYSAPNLRKILGDQKILKIFHFARFDLAVIKYYLEVECTPVYCTKIASKLCRTFTDRHGLKDICRDLLGVEVNKQQQSSDWGADELNEEQMKYAAGDVLYLHRLRDVLDELLKREGRYELAQECFSFLKTRADLDLYGWGSVDIFSHS